MSDRDDLYCSYYVAICDDCGASHGETSDHSAWSGQPVTGQTQDALAAIRHYVHQISDMVDNLTERQQHALTTALLQYAAFQRSHDPAIRTRRLRRHWGPRRLAAARGRKETT